MDPEITLASSGSDSSRQPFLHAGSYALAVACSSASNGSTTVAFPAAAGVTAT